MCVRSVGFYDFISVFDCTCSSPSWNFTFHIHCLCESTDVLSVWLQRISTTCNFFQAFSEKCEKNNQQVKSNFREKKQTKIWLQIDVSHVARILCCFQEVGTLQLNQIPTDLILWSPPACSYVITQTNPARHTIYSELYCSSPWLLVISNTFRTNCHSRFSASLILQTDTRVSVKISACSRNKSNMDLNCDTCWEETAAVRNSLWSKYSKAWAVCGKMDVHHWGGLRASENDSQDSLTERCFIFPPKTALRPLFPFICRTGESLHWSI